jgi:hypothetical protein
VTALAAYGDGVAVTGRFGVSGAVRLPHAGIWTGERWQTFGQGLAHDPYADGHLHAVVATASGVYAGGFIGGRFGELWSGRFKASGQNSLVLFDTHAPPDPADPVAGYRRLPGVTFESMPGAVRALQVLGGELYVGGTFDHAGVMAFTAPPDPGFPAANLRPGGTTRARGRPRAARTTTPPHSRRWTAARSSIGGWFDHAGPIAASAVVQHDPPAGTWTAYGSGIGFGPRSGPTVRALAQSPATGSGSAGRSPSRAGRRAAASRCGGAPRAARPDGPDLRTAHRAEPRSTERAAASTARPALRRPARR